MDGVVAAATIAPPAVKRPLVPAARLFPHFRLCPLLPDVRPLQRDPHLRRQVLRHRLRRH